MPKHNSDHPNRVMRTKAAPRFELGIKDLQSSALPLGHAADKDMIESLNDPTSNAPHSLLILCNGHGEDVIALEIIKIILKKIKIIFCFLQYLQLIQLKVQDNQL